MLGIALGCIGLSLKDFEQCTPSEFKAVFDSWKERREGDERSEWERVRMSCLCSLQPYSKNKLKTSDIMVFPWEIEAKKETPREELTKEQEMKRCEEAIKRYGLL